MFSQVKLSVQAITYIQMMLESGGTLAHTTLRLPLEHGSVSTYLPSGALPIDERRLNQGGVIAQPGAWAMAGQIVDNWLTTRPDAVVLFEDAVTRLEDPVLTRPHPPLCYAGREVYYFLSADVDTIALREGIRWAGQDTLRYARSYRLIVWLTSGLPDLGLGDGQELTSHMLERIVDATRMLLISAFDGEGFLLWQGQEMP